MEPLLLAIVLGLAPMLAYALVLWRLDHWEHEPWPLVAGAFFWGAAPAVALAIILAVTLDSWAATTRVYQTWRVASLPANYVATFVVIGPVVEELCKGAALLALFVWRRQEIDNVFDGLLYGALIGFGFAGVENALYFWRLGGQSEMSLSLLVFLRAGAFGLNHALYTSLAGVGFAWARFDRRPAARALLPLAGLAAGTLLHALHNGLIGYGWGGVAASLAAIASGLVWMGVIAAWSLERQGRWLALALREEVAAGVLTAAQAARAASTRRRLADAFGLGTGWLFGQRQYRLDQLAAELAQKKEQLARFGDEQGNAQAVAALRAALRAASQAT